MSDSVQLIVFHLDGQRYALPLEIVERAVRAVEITPLAKAPDIVLGVVDVAGRILPVLNVRRRFRLPERPIDPSDQFLIALAGGRAVALVVDEVEQLVAQPVHDIVEPSRIAPGIEQIQGVAILPDGLVLIQDLARFLSLDEAAALDEALKNGEAADGH